MSEADIAVGRTVPAFRLNKVVGVLAVVASAVAAEYGAGINFVSVQSLSVYPGVHGLVPLAMFVTGILLLPKTYLFMVFSRAIPCAGSKYIWVGRSLGVPAGFVVTFLYWATSPPVIGVLAFAFGTFLGQAVAGIDPALGAALLTPTGHLICGFGAIGITYAVNMAGVHRYATFVTVLLGVIVVVAVIICGFGFSTSSATFVAAASKAAHVDLAPPAVVPPDNLFHFVSTCALFIFAYAGLGSGPALGGEVRDPQKTLPRGIMYGWLIALVLFSAVAAALFHAAPWWAITGLIKAGKSAYATAPGLIGLAAPKWISIALNLAVALIVGKTIAPVLMVSSRYLFAFGQDRLLPSSFAQTNRHKVPHTALTLLAVLGALFLVQSIYAGWALGVAARSLGVLVVWLALAVGVLSFKWHPRYRALPWAPLVTQQKLAVPAAILSIVLAVPLIVSLAVVPHTPLMFQPLVQAVLVVVLGVVIAAIARARARARGDSFREMAARLPIE